VKTPKYEPQGTRKTGRRIGRNGGKKDEFLEREPGRRVDDMIRGNGMIKKRQERRTEKEDSEPRDWGMGRGRYTVVISGRGSNLQHADLHVAPADVQLGL